MTSVWLFTEFLWYAVDTRKVYVDNPLAMQEKNVATFKSHVANLSTGIRSLCVEMPAVNMETKLMYSYT
jgi:hypothetical protein